MVVIVDYGMGNLTSVQNIFERLRIPATVSGDHDTIRAAKKLVLPGVGNFAEGMANLNSRGLIPVLEDKVLREKTPLLGICLGMQLLTRRSEEGEAAGLGWVDGQVIKFRFASEGPKMRLPHVGFNTVSIVQSPLFARVPTDARFYFTHSYHVMCENESEVIARTEYGYPFASAIQKGNLFGTQFHPEKSHSAGTLLVQSFLEID